MVGCVWLTHIWNDAKKPLLKSVKVSFMNTVLSKLLHTVGWLLRRKAKAFNSKSSGVRSVVVYSVFISFCIFRSDFNWIIYGSSIQIITAILERITLNGCIWNIARGASKMLLSWVRKLSSVDTFSKHYGMDWEHIVYKLCYWPIILCITDRIDYTSFLWNVKKS